jgi:hypothetical protein
MLKNLDLIYEEKKFFAMSDSIICAAKIIA